MRQADYQGQGLWEWKLIMQRRCNESYSDHNLIWGETHVRRGRRLRGHILCDKSHAELNTNQGSRRGSELKRNTNYEQGKKWKWKIILANDWKIGRKLGMLDKVFGTIKWTNWNCNEKLHEQHEETLCLGHKRELKQTNLNTTEYDEKDTDCRCQVELKGCNVL